MSKTADTSVEIHPLLANRWSPRAFSDQPVPAETVTALLEAARWSPSGLNGQPWRFIVSRRGESALFAQMVDCLMEGNQIWAKNAAVLMFAVAETTRPNGKPNGSARHDVGQAVANLTVQAGEMGLYVHQMGGIYRDKIKTVYDIPEGYEVAIGIAVGYLGDAAALPDDLAERETAPRERKPLNEIAFTEKWGNPL